MINNINDVLLYLDDIKVYVHSIIYFHDCSENEKQELDLKEILAYLSTVNEIVDDIKNYLCDLSFIEN